MTSKVVHDDNGEPRLVEIVGGAHVPHIFVTNASGAVTDDQLRASPIPVTIDVHVTGYEY